MSITRIPVFLNVHAGDQQPIGFGTIEDGKLTIVIDNDILVSHVEHLVRAEDIKELFLGFGFPVHPSVTERVHHSEHLAILRLRERKRARDMKAEGYSNADIAEAMGLSESSIRTILHVQDGEAQ